MKIEEVQKWLKNNIFKKDGQFNTIFVRKIKIKYNDIYKEILNLTAFLNDYYENITLRQRIWHILNNSFELNLCKNCKKINKWSKKGNKYTVFCSQRCCSQYTINKKPPSFNGHCKKLNKMPYTTFIKVINKFHEIEKEIEWKIDPNNKYLVLVKCCICGKWYNPKNAYATQLKRIFPCCENCKEQHPLFSKNGHKGISHWNGAGVDFVWFNTYAPKINWCEETKSSPDNKLMVKCIYCHEWFIPTYIQVLQRLNGINNGTNYFYCSELCKFSCPLFNKKKYIVGHEVYYEKTIFPQLRKMVFERDEYTCQICGKTLEEAKLNNTWLTCHHIYPQKLNPIESADIDNCITLCRECHNRLHTDLCNFGFLSKCIPQW
jgi:hypothetical protein